MHECSPGFSLLAKEVKREEGHLAPREPNELYPKGHNVQGRGVPPERGCGAPRPAPQEVTDA